MTIVEENNTMISDFEQIFLDYIGAYDGMKCLDMGFQGLPSGCQDE